MKNSKLYVSSILFVASLILSFVFSGCLFAPPASRDPVIQGRVFIEDLGKSEVQGHPVSGATVQVMEVLSERVVAETTSDQNGYYSLSAPPGGPYLVRATRENLKLLDLSPVTEENNLYDLDLIGIVSTATTMVYLDIVAQGYDPKSVDVDSIPGAPSFQKLLDNVRQIVEAQGDPTGTNSSLQVAQEVADELLSPGNAEETVVIPPVRNTTQGKYYSKIQDAIDEAQDGDIIVASPRTYKENIDFKGKNITLESKEPDNPQMVAKTVIDGGGKGSVVTFQNGEGNGAVLRGFTIQNGSGSYPSSKRAKDQASTAGGGILISGASPTIEKNIIKRNTADYGGGIYIEGGMPLLYGNEVSENSSTYGAGICVLSSLAGKGKNKNKAVTNAPVIGGSASAQKNVIRDNKASALGGGIYIDYESSAYSVDGSNDIPWDRIFYTPPSGWPTPNYAVFNTFSGNTHGGGTTGSQVYFEARNITFSASGQGSIKVFNAEVTGTTLACPVHALLEIQAFPQTDWVFQIWSATQGMLSDAGSSSTNYRVVEDDATVSVIFLPLRSVTFEREGSGDVSVSVSYRPAAYSDFQGTISSFPQSKKYVQGTVLTLSASPGTNYAFSEWVVNGSTSKNQSESFTITQDTTIKAVFVPTYQISVSSNPAGGGTARITKVNGQSITPTTSVRVPAGTVLTIEAQPAATYTFKEWSATAGTIGNASSSTTTYTTPAQDATVTAHFELMRAITFKINPEGKNLGGILVDGVLVLNGASETQVTKYYPDGSQIQIEASNMYGTFQSWSIGGSNPQTYTVSSDTTITATYDPPPVLNDTQKIYYQTISQALGEAQSGDTILVGPGTYVEPSLYIPSGVTLKSKNGASQTIIDGGGENSGSISMGSNSTIDGFTIQNFVNSSSNATIYLGSNSQVCNNRIQNNRNKGYGIVYVGFASGCSITNNIITNNTAQRGSGVYIQDWSSIATFSGNEITGNGATVGDFACWYGGGVCIADPPGSDECTIAQTIKSNNTVSGNQAFNCPNIHIYDTCCDTAC